MATITQSDLIDSIADSLQFMSYFHPLDFITAVNEAYEREESQAAKAAMAQILINSRMCAQGRRPICQDTGIVTVFVNVGMDVSWDAELSLTDMINEGVRRAYTHPDNVLRASILADPAGARKNTGDNTPAVIHYDIVPGDKVEVFIAAKGGGSENKAKLAMLNPSDSIVDWVLETVPKMGAGWCPPGMLGIGIGGTAEKAALLAKRSLMDPIDIHQLRERGPNNRVEELRLELMDKVNQLGIGAQGLGGLTTVLDVKILDYPTHAASKPVAMIPNCAATRHLHFVLDGSGAASFSPPSIDDWPDITWDAGADAIRVDLETVTPAEIQSWKPGQTILLNGKLLTGRDAAHKRMTEMLDRGESLPVDLKGRFIYYVGPVKPVRDEAVGPGGTYDFNSHGQVHSADAGRDGTGRDDRKGRTRRRRHRCNQRIRRGVSDGRRRRRVSGVQSDQEFPSCRFRRARNGSNLRVRSGRHASHRRRRQPGRLGPPHRPRGMATIDRSENAVET